MLMFQAGVAVLGQSFGQRRYLSIYNSAERGFHRALK